MYELAARARGDSGPEVLLARARALRVLGDLERAQRLLVEADRLARAVAMFHCAPPLSMAFISSAFKRRLPVLPTPAAPDPQKNRGFPKFDEARRRPQPRSSTKSKRASEAPLNRISSSGR